MSYRCIRQCFHAGVKFETGQTGIPDHLVKYQSPHLVKETPEPEWMKNPPEKKKVSKKDLAPKVEPETPEES